jgi:hypothetical protein
MAVLGQLLVELGLNTAAFKGGCDRATYMGKQFSRDMKASFSELGSSFSQLGSTIGAGFGPLGGVLSGITQGINAVGAAIKTSTSNVPVMMQLAGATAGVGAAAVAAAAGFAALSIAGAKLGEELNHNAIKLGVTTAQMAGLKYAADFVDLPIQTLVRGFAKFAKEIGNIGEKVTPASSLLKELGVTAGTGTYEAFVKTTTAIQNMHDPVQRMNVATELFGTRIGLQLLPLLADSTHSLSAFAEMAKEAGVSIDENGVKKTEDWKFATEHLSAAWDGVKLKGFAANSSIIALTDSFATFIETATNEGTWDLVRDNLAVIGNLASGNGLKVSSKVSTEHTNTNAGPPVDPAKVKADADALSSANALVKVAREHFNLVGATGNAARALKEAEDEIREKEEGIAGITGKTVIETRQMQAAAWEQAAALEAQLPALKEAAKLEREFPENTKKLIALTEELKEKREKMFGSTAVGHAIFESQKEDLKEQDKELAVVTASVREYVASLKGVGDAIKASETADMRQGHKQEEEALRAKQQSWLISERQFQLGMKAIYTQELKDEQDLIKEKIDAAMALTGGKQAGAAGNTTAQNQALAKVIQLQTQLNAVTAQYTDKINSTNTALLKLSGFARAGFAQFVIETKSVGQAIQENITKSLDGVTKSLARSAVEGKHLGAAMKQVGQEIAESMIESGLRILASWILTHIGMSAITKTTAATDAATQIAANKAVGLSAAGLAGAQGVASFAAAPWPIDMGAPAFGASMAASAATFNAFEQGGIVPQTGLAMVHQNEMVLPRPIAEKVQAMADPETSGARRGASVTNNFRIDTKDANSFRLSQHQIDARAAQASQKALRRNGGL